MIGCFYKSTRELVSYFDLIDESISLALSTRNKVIVLGDFNSDCLGNPHRHIQQLMNMNGLHQLITEPTRYSDGTSKLIDLILTPCPEIVGKVGVLPPVKSDHCCVYVEIKNSITTNYTFKRTLYIYSKLDEEEYLNKLSNVNWTDLVSLNTVDTAANLFSEKIMDIGKSCMPVKTISVRENDKPWITEEIKKQIRKKKKNSYSCQNFKLSLGGV